MHTYTEKQSNTTTSSKYSYFFQCISEAEHLIFRRSNWEPKSVIMSISTRGADGAMPAASAAIPHLPSAAQPDLVRAHQKDDYYRKVRVQKFELEKWNPLLEIKSRAFTCKKDWHFDPFSPPLSLSVRTLTAHIWIRLWFRSAVIRPAVLERQTRCHRIFRWFLVLCIHHRVQLANARGR